MNSALKPMHATSRKDGSLQGSFIMRKISLFLLLVSLFVFFSSSLSAAPATKGICEDLKAKGVTKGLFGLCVAYCEAGANSERVLENYNRKKKDSDPAMPCLEAQKPTLGCACWNTLTADEIGANQDPVGCTLDPSGDFIAYQSGSDFEFLAASEGTCTHYNSATGADLSIPGNGGNEPLSPEQEAQCRWEILKLAEQPVFSEFDCLPDPAP
jgi:hypothetical protein